MSDKENFYKTMYTVMSAIVQAGYEPRSQLLGYVQTGDLTYITRKNNARQLVASLDIDELKSYLTLNMEVH